MLGFDALGSLPLSGIPEVAAGAIEGTLSATEAQDTASFSGVLVYSGSLAATEGQDTASLAGTLVYSGPLTATEAQDTAAFSGALVYSGALSAAEAQDTASLAGALVYSGALTATEAQDAASFDGTVSSGDVSGDLAATEAQDVALFTGAVEVIATATGGGRKRKDTAHYPPQQPAKPWTEPYRAAIRDRIEQARREAEAAKVAEREALQLARQRSLRRRQLLAITAARRAEIARENARREELRREHERAALEARAAQMAIEAEIARLNEELTYWTNHLRDEEEVMLLAA